MEEVYLEVFKNFPPFCQECGKPLPISFRNLLGKVKYKNQYSHVLPKSVYPEFKYNYLNFNRLCDDHHQQWENGDRHSMNIWQLNIQIPIIGEIVKNNR